MSDLDYKLGQTLYVYVMHTHSTYVTTHFSEYWATPGNCRGWYVMRVTEEHAPKEKPKPIPSYLKLVGGE